MTTARAGVVPPSPPDRTPSRLVGDGTSLSAVINSGKSPARGSRVVHEARRQQLAGRRIVVAVLEQRLADALGDAAMRLAMHDQRD